MDKAQHAAQLVAVLDALKAAGWITGYSIITDPWVVDWTEHGLLRRAQLVAIDDELDPGGAMWAPLTAICKFLTPLPPDKSTQTGLN